MTTEQAMTTTRSSGASNKAERAAHEANDSEALHQGARVGLIALGVVHLLVGWLALQLALGSSEGSADSGGAMQQLAETSVGKPLLWLLVLGFVALVLWKLAEAAVGHKDEDDEKKRAGKRVFSAGKAVIFGILAFSAAKAASGSSGGGGNSKQESLTGKLMEAPLGQGLVGLVGLALIGYGAFYVYRGWKEKFREQLEAGAGGGHVGSAIITVGKVGHIAKGFAIAVLGVLVVVAAVQHDPEKSGGLDDALKELLSQPSGHVLVGIIGVGIACYGLYCFGRAKYLKHTA
ncbi:MAG: DUF1206 domain-containing protein [Solirubrobacteraceae bacterium]|nr:DUF1206 domain-containing protein [Solirubrobacteraceae bacterium]